MKNKKALDAKNAQCMVSNTMDEMSRATKKVLIDYLSISFCKSFAKAIAYLEVDPQQADDILVSLDPEIRKRIINLSKDFKKNDSEVVSEVEHILTTEGMTFGHDYQKIKENILFTGQSFAEESLKKFRSDMPIFQEKLNNCLFSFEDILLLDNRSIQKILRDTDQQELAKALKGTDPELQDKIFCCMSPRAASMLKEDMEFMGPVPETEVRASQAGIIKTIFRLEEEGDISIARVTVGELIE